MTNHVKVTKKEEEEEEEEKQVGPTTTTPGDGGGGGDGGIGGGVDGDDDDDNGCCTTDGDGCYNRTLRSMRDEISRHTTRRQKIRRGAAMVISRRCQDDDQLQQQRKQTQQQQQQLQGQQQDIVVTVSIIPIVPSATSATIATGLQRPSPTAAAGAARFLAERVRRLLAEEKAALYRSALMELSPSPLLLARGAAEKATTTDVRIGGGGGGSSPYDSPRGVPDEFWISTTKTAMTAAAAAAAAADAAAVSAATTSTISPIASWPPPPPRLSSSSSSSSSSSLSIMSLSILSLPSMPDGRLRPERVRQQQLLLLLPRKGTHRDDKDSSCCYGCDNACAANDEDEESSRLVPAAGRGGAVVVPQKGSDDVTVPPLLHGGVRMPPPPPMVPDPAKSRRKTDPTEQGARLVAVGPRPTSQSACDLSPSTFDACDDVNADDTSKDDDATGHGYCNSSNSYHQYADEEGSWILLGCENRIRPDSDSSGTDQCRGDKEETGHECYIAGDTNNVASCAMTNSTISPHDVTANHPTSVTGSLLASTCEPSTALEVAGDEVNHHMTVNHQKEIDVASRAYGGIKGMLGWSKDNVPLVGLVMGCAEAVTNGVAQVSGFAGPDLRHFDQDIMAPKLKQFDATFLESNLSCRSHRGGRDHDPHP